MDWFLYDIGTSVMTDLKINDAQGIDFVSDLWGWTFSLTSTSGKHFLCISKTNTNTNKN